MRRRVLGGLVVLLAIAGAAIAAAPASIELQVLDGGQPVVGAQVALFLSCDKLQGATGEEGRVVLETTCGGGFYWVEIDGRRVDTLFQVEGGLRAIDVAEVAFITWQGGR